MALATVQNIGEIQFPHRPAPEASLFVYEHQSHVPFKIGRVFVVKADKDCRRGAHAHRECTQLLVCLAGKILMTFKDGKDQKVIAANSPEQGILVPPGIWGEQEYTKGSILMVLTDRPYDEADYIRDYDEFVHYRKVP